MGRRFAEIAFTENVKEQQRKHGSRRQYERMEQGFDSGDHLGPDEREFIESRDGFYLGSVSETGWPYIQFRGGKTGFLRVIDDRTLGFADLRGNRQYISTGNLLHDNRTALFLMDYASQTRLKILGRAEILEDSPEAFEQIERMRIAGESTAAERAILIRVEGFDWNCQQHIPPRYTEQEIARYVEPMRERIKVLEAEIAALRGSQ